MPWITIKYTRRIPLYASRVAFGKERSSTEIRHVDEYNSSTKKMIKVGDEQVETITQPGINCTGFSHSIKVGTRAFSFGTGYVCEKHYSSVPTRRILEREFSNTSNYSKYLIIDDQED